MALSAIPPSPPIQMKEPQPFFGWGGLFVHPECVKNTRKSCAFLAQFAIFVLWKSFHSGFGSNPYTRYDLATMVVRYHVDSSVDAEQARHQPTLNPKC